jgi:hypothetical protein
VNRKKLTKDLKAAKARLIDAVARLDADWAQWRAWCDKHHGEGLVLSKLQRNVSRALADLQRNRSPKNLQRFDRAMLKADAFKITMTKRPTGNWIGDLNEAVANEARQIVHLERALEVKP